MRRGLAPLMQPPDQPAGVVAAIAGQNIAPAAITCTTLTATGAILAGAAASIGFTGRSILSSASDGNILASNAAATSFGLLQLGGTTSSFPAIKRSAARTNSRLADDSANATHLCANIALNSAGVVDWGDGSRAKMGSSADGIIELYNAAQTDFTRLNFGGTTSSFPALKRSTTTLQARLADDSAYTLFQANELALGNGATGFWGTSSGTLSLRSDAAINISTTTNAVSTKDIGLQRSGTNQMQVTQGAGTGSFGDLSLRTCYFPGGATPALRSTAAITSGAGASTGTLLNAPAAGNPTSWIPINDNGTTRYIPAW